MGEAVNYDDVFEHRVFAQQGPQSIPPTTQRSATVGAKGAHLVHIQFILS
jgi:hypothetical protein